MTIYDLSLAGLRTGLDKREFSAVEITTGYLQRIAATNSGINTFISICNETALAEAEAADRLITAGQASPLIKVRRRCSAFPSFFSGSLLRR